MKRKLAIALTSALAAVALSACGPEDTSPGDGASETPSASEEATEEPTEESETEESETEEAETDEADGGETGGDLTPPGTELSIGDTATVTTEEGAVVNLTVTEIEEGTSAQLDEMQVDADTSTLTPFFVKVTAEVVSGDAANFDPAVDITGLIGENQGADQLIKFQAFAPCENDGFDPGAQPGDTVESCTIQIADKGSTVDGAAYTANDTDYDRYDGQPVVWRS